MTQKRRSNFVRKLILPLCFWVVLAMSSCSGGPQIPNAFVGTWQSDEKLTLASLENSDLVSEDDLALFSDDFFGDRVFVYTPRKFRAYWVGQKSEGVEQGVQWLAYDIVDSGPDFMTLRYQATEYSDSGIKTWRVDGDLIYVEESKWDFKEYYRRIDE